MPYSQPIVDYLLGVVVFDGKVWHVALAALLALLVLALGGALALSMHGGASADAKRVASKKNR